MNQVNFYSINDMPRALTIPIDQINPLPHRRGKQRRVNRFRRCPSQKRAVVLLKNGEYFLLFGTGVVAEASAKGENFILATVRRQVTEEQEDTYRVSDEYFGTLLPPMELSKSFHDYRAKYDVGLNQFSKRTGISPASTHHYESLRKNLAKSLWPAVDKGDLTFKEARAIADLPNDKTQELVAAPFVDGKLSSVYVEQVVAEAKERPDLPVWQIVESTTGLVLAPSPAKETEETTPPTVVQSRGNGHASDNDLNAQILAVAGGIEAVSSSAVPQYQRLRLMSSMKILRARIDRALVSL